MDIESRIEQLQQQLEILQTQVAFQDHTIEALNAALQEQQQELELMRRQWDALSSRYRQLQSQLDTGEPAAEPPPPHY